MSIRCRSLTGLRPFKTCWGCGPHKDGSEQNEYRLRAVTNGNSGFQDAEDIPSTKTRTESICLFCRSRRDVGAGEVHEAARTFLPAHGPLG
jgi:hypothetical protein